MQGSLTGKTALITGSSEGIGYAVAEKLAASGCAIVLNGIDPDEAVRPKLEALRNASGAKAIYCRQDVGDTAAVEAMIAAAEDRFGGIDILVNNAVTRVFGAIEDTDPADWDRAMAVNVGSAFNTIRCALPGMKRRDWGRIINMSSIYGMIGATDRASYVVSKTALIGLTRAVALEVTGFDITCNAVCPGSVKTARSIEMIEAGMTGEGLSEEEATARFLAGKQPTGRFVSAESIAALCAFLCTAEAGDINGAALPVDMAWSAA